jgi:hypothetical protein
MMRRVAHCLAVATLALTALALATADPAWAGCVASPDNADARIRGPGGAYIGDGVLNCEPPNMGNSQSITISRKAGKAPEFEVRVRNIGDNAEDLVVNGSAEIGADFKVRYFRGNREITEKVTSADGKVFRDIPDGGSTPVVRMRMKVKNTAQQGEDGASAMWGRRADFPMSGYDAVWATVVVAAP